MMAAQKNAEIRKKITRKIAVWRQHAFEWIIGNDSWDEVEVNT